MFPHSDKLQALLVTQNIHAFSELLLKFLKPGKENIYEHALKLNKEGNLEDLKTFYYELLDSEPALCQFLDNWYEALYALEQMNWDQALSLFESISRNYLHGVSLKQHAILEKIEQCAYGVQIQEHAERGNEYYQDHQWKAALSEYLKAERLLHKELPFSKEELESVIEICEAGIIFDQHIVNARQFFVDEAWEDACKEYEYAKAAFVNNFEPTLAEIDEEITICQRRQNSNSFLLMTRKVYEKKFAIFTMGLMLGVSSFVMADYLKSSPESMSPVEAKEQKMIVEEAGEMASFVSNTDVKTAQFELEEAKTDAPKNELGSLNVGNETSLKTTESAIASNKQALDSPKLWIDIAGKRRTSEKLTFTLENYDPAYTYSIDFGNGERRRISQHFDYIYEDAGDYTLLLEAIHKTGKIASFKKELKIEMGSVDNLFAEIVNVDKNEESLLGMSRTVSEKQSDLVKTGTKQAIGLTEENHKAFTNSITPVPFTEVAPKFPGGESAMFKFINQRLKYPQRAQENGIEGRVFVRFVVHVDGTLSDISIIRGIGAGCDEVVKEIVEEMPLWIPGKQEGRKVATWHTLPFTFKLQ